MTRFLTSVLVVLILTAGIHAAVITPVDATASSTFGIEYNPLHLIDNSGLVAGLHDVNYPNMWLSNEEVTATLTFDLGDIYTLSAAEIWQYNSVNNGLDRGVRDFTIAVSNNNVSWTTVGTYTLTESPGGNIPAQIVPFSATGRYVRFSVLTNYGDTYTGLSEVKFEGEQAPNEPIPTLSPGMLALLSLLISLAALAVIRRTN